MGVAPILSDELMLFFRYPGRAQAGKDAVLGRILGVVVVGILMASICLSGRLFLGTARLVEWEG